MDRCTGCRDITEILFKTALNTMQSINQSLKLAAKPNSSVGRVADLRTGGRGFDPQLGQYSFRGLMIVIATGFIPRSPLSIVLTMAMWESTQWLGKNIVRSTG